MECVIYVARNGEQLGGWPLEDARQLFLSGQLLESDWGWVEGMAEWHPLWEVISSYGATIAQNLTPQNGVVSYVLAGEITEADGVIEEFKKSKAKNKKPKQKQRNRPRHDWREDAATESQLQFLANLKVRNLPRSLTKGQAHDLIEIRVEGGAGLSPKQFACLSYHGYNPQELGFNEALHLLDEIHSSPEKFSVPEPWQKAKYRLYPQLYPKKNGCLVVLFFLIALAIAIMMAAAGGGASGHHH